MKKIVAGILALGIIFSLFGCSEENGDYTPKNNEYGDILISEKMAVPQQYTFETKSETGISTIKVNANIVVPKVYGVDVLKAEPQIFSDEYLKKFVDRYKNNQEWKHPLSDNNDKYTGGGFIKEELANGLSGLISYQFLIDSKKEFDNGGDYYSIESNFWLNEKTNEVTFRPFISYTKGKYTPIFSSLEPLNDENKAENCSITLEEAIQYAQSEAEFIGDDFELFSYGQTPVISGVQNPQYYGFIYTREINGIAVNDINDIGVGSDDIYVAPPETLKITVRDDGVCWVEYVSPFKTGDVVKSNVALLPFEDIADVFEKVSILSIKHLELDDDLQENNMDVYEIRFGYMPIKQPDKAGIYYFVPVWDFYAKRTLFGTGGYARGKDFPPRLGEPALTINAIDGTVVDRRLGY